MEIERYPTVEAPPEVEPGVEFAVLVMLTEELLTPEVGSGPITFELPPKDRWLLDVVVSASGFSFRDGRNAANLTLPRSGPSDIASFHLTAKPIEEPHREARLFVTFLHEGSFVARVSRPIRVVAPGQPATEPPRPDPVAPGAATNLSLGRDAADLVLFVENDELRIHVPSFVPLPEVPIVLNDGMRQWLENQYELLSAAGGRGVTAVDGAPDPAAVARAIGRELWEKLAPRQLQEIFWQLVDQERAGLGSFDTIQIYSDDPVIPWELMRPSRDVPPEELGFLGLEYQVARWHIKPNQTRLSRSPASLVLEEMVVLRPSYARPLAGTERELEMLRAHSPVPLREEPGSYAGLQAVSQRLPAGILHFAGHGVETVAATGGSRYALVLEERSVSLLEWKGLLPVAPTGKPFIFFNACDLGRTHRLLGFVEGWAPTMLDAGASGYLGALWPVDDASAARFAESFYLALEAKLATGPVAATEVIREARRFYLEEADPTYLAYVFYGDTDLRLAVR